MEVHCFTPSKKSFLLAGKVIASVFWDADGFLMADYILYISAKVASNQWLKLCISSHTLREILNSSAVENSVKVRCLGKQAGWSAKRGKFTLEHR